MAKQLLQDYFPVGRGRKVPAFLLVLVSAPYVLVVRHKMKIKDLPNWPPQPGGAFNAQVADQRPSRIERTRKGAG
jgi:hypothetical protein